MCIRDSCKQWNAVPVKDTTLDTLLKEMRAVKTEKEIENIKAAQSITDAAFTHILDYICLLYTSGDHFELVFSKRGYFFKRLCLSNRFRNP